MAKTVELRRHTDSAGDALTPEGVIAAVEIGTRLSERYDLLVSSGAQRATQTLACFLAGMGQRQPCGVTVDEAFRSPVEDRWRACAKKAEGGDLLAFRRVDPELVDAESARHGAALQSVIDALPDGGRALVVGHSPIHEAAVYGLTGEVVGPLSKGGGVSLVCDGGRFRAEAVPT